MENIREKGKKINLKMGGFNLLGYSYHSGPHYSLSLPTPLWLPSILTISVPHIFIAHTQNPNPSSARHNRERERERCDGDGDSSGNVKGEFGGGWS